MPMHVRRWRNTMACSCLLLWCFSQTVIGSNFKTTGGSVRTMEMDEPPRDLQGAENNPVSADHVDSPDDQIDIGAFREIYESSIDENQEKSPLDSLSDANMASFRQAAGSASPPVGVVQPRPVPAPPLDQTRTQTNPSSSAQTRPSWRASAGGTPWNPQPEHKASSASRNQMKQKLESTLGLFDIPSLKMQFGKGFQDPVAPGRPLSQSFLPHDSAQQMQKIPPSLQSQITDLITGVPAEILDTLLIFDSLLQPERLENRQRALEEALADSKTAANPIRSFFWYRPRPLQRNSRLPSPVETQPAIKLPSPDDMYRDLILNKKGSPYPDPTSVDSNLKEKYEKGAETRTSNKREHIDAKSPIREMEGIAQQLTNPEYASGEIKDSGQIAKSNPFGWAFTQTAKSNPFGWAFTQMANALREIRSEIGDQLQRLNPPSFSSFWALGRTAGDETNLIKDADDTVENVQSYLHEIFQDGGTSFPESPFQGDKPNPSADSEHLRQGHRHPRHASSSEDDEPVVVYVPGDLPVGHKLLDPPQEIREVHTEKTVYSIIPNIDVAKVNDRGQIFLSARTDVNVVYDFAIRATQSTGFIREQRVHLFFQDNNDVVVRCHHPTRAYRKPGAVVASIKVLTVMPQRSIEIFEPAMRDLFFVQPDGTVRVKADPRQLDKNLYQFRVVVKNPADETVKADLSVIALFQEDGAPAAIDQWIPKGQRFVIISIFLVTAITVIGIAGIFFLKRLRPGKRFHKKCLAACTGAFDHLKSSNIKLGRPKTRLQRSKAKNPESSACVVTKKHPETSSANENMSIYEEFDNSDKQKLV